MERDERNEVSDVRRDFWESLYVSWSGDEGDMVASSC